MVEELYFQYALNSNQEADFKDANLELKCTPLLETKESGKYRIKERLVCTMIDYFKLPKTSFEESHLLSKCRLMLLLFYLHVSGQEIYDLKFIFRVLWELPEKDLIIIKNDYDTIVEKVKNGEAHLISEGDTLFLGACRKGQKGDALQAQPYSDYKANKRAFSLKPAYMRYILNHVVESGKTYYCNYSGDSAHSNFELVKAEDLEKSSFEEIIRSRFTRFIGKNYNQVCKLLGVEPYQAKSKYADIAALIASDGKSKRIASSDEFLKSGIIMKTIRLNQNGMPKESMSFKNIDYSEIISNESWIDSELYEIFTSRFLFVVFKPDSGNSIEVFNRKTGHTEIEQSYALDKVLFWTMPQDDLKVAQNYWKDIRNKVLNNNISKDAFWKLSDRNMFHVRPKATNSLQLAENPHGGKCPKFCYWFNAEYIKRIIND